ncbi:hypothetical protein ACS15_3649 [Ralstonia insidiosa]|uniref:Uncharacterized protein n=1 Tax=Ralstonia insidiosa TaxID=190721 RepID=A0AAC9BFK6_9RALS|nr:MULTISPECIES: hypothetical protein [Ralstonia]ANH73231.1 hypothetical protein ACS15_3649 [Ralstonia insidiosa]EPX95490.1 hypothetical protein C404_24205 [Ralstonia sp. AU12-08]MBY4707381.1 hypothetical protein [Ralstonia insidiosa]GAQ28744.1 hypothetical protein SAMD00023378_2427 [Ralstonia sp. NT80]
MKAKIFAAVAVCSVAAAWWSFSYTSESDAQKSAADSTTGNTSATSGYTQNNNGSRLNPQVGAVENQAGRPGVKSTDFDASVAGIDANKNGVRDDIERYIEKKYPDPAQRAAMMQYAKARQNFILTATTPEKAHAAAQDLWRAFACTQSRLGAGWLDATKDVLAMFLNTRERLNASTRAQDNLAGQTVDAYAGDKPCD